MSQYSLRVFRISLYTQTHIDIFVLNFFVIFHFASFSPRTLHTFESNEMLMTMSTPVTMPMRVEMILLFFTSGAPAGSVTG